MTTCTGDVKSVNKDSLDRDLFDIQYLDGDVEDLFMRNSSRVSNQRIPYIISTHNFCLF